MSGYLPNHLMARFLVTAIAVLLAASTSIGAEQKDVLLVVLDVNGEQTMQFQPSPHGSCSKFLASFRESTKRGVPVSLTLEGPPKVTGRVVEVSCIRPNGSVQKP
jgi:hypothetical protein